MLEAHSVPALVERGLREEGGGEGRFRKKRCRERFLWEGGEEFGCKVSVSCLRGVGT